jgi:hypothetical protein
MATGGNSERQRRGSLRLDQGEEGPIDKIELDHELPHEQDDRDGEIVPGLLPCRKFILRGAAARLRLD